MLLGFSDSFLIGGGGGGYFYDSESQEINFGGGGGGGIQIANLSQVVRRHKKKVLPYLNEMTQSKFHSVGGGGGCGTCSKLEGSAFCQFQPS